MYVYFEVVHYLTHFCVLKTLKVDEHANTGYLSVSTHSQQALSTTQHPSEDRVLQHALKLSHGTRVKDIVILTAVVVHGYGLFFSPCTTE